MERRRQQKTGPEDQEQRPFGVEVSECGPGHDRQHQGAGQIAGRHRARQNGLDDGEGPLVRAPMLGVGGQTRPERGPRLGVGKMKENEHRATSHREAGPVASGERGQRGDGGHLGESREGQSGTHGPGRPRPRREPPARRVDGGAGGGGIVVRRVRGVARGTIRGRGQGEQDQGHERENAQSLHVSAPSRFDHQQRRPCEEDERPGDGAAGSLGHLRQQQTGREVRERPHDLEPRNRRAREGDGRERHLGEGRIDGGDGGVVDARVPRGSNGLELRRVRRVQVGIDARQLHVPVPEVAVDVVGQKRNAGE